MNFNALVQWMAESGEGSWAAFCNAVAWLNRSSAPTEPVGASPNEPTSTSSDQDRPSIGSWINAGSIPTRLQASETKPHTVAFQLSGLGYLEIDWSSGRWAVAAPCVALLPSEGGYGMLLGGRTRKLLAELDRATDESVTSRMLLRRQQPGAPDTIYIAGSEKALTELAEILGIPFESRIAERISLLLPRIEQVVGLEPSVPPPYGFELYRWNSPGFRQVPNSDRPGLYKGGSSGRPQYRFHHGERFFEVDGPTGFYAELSRKAVKVLRYRRQSVNGTLWRPIWAPFPTLQERAATMCSGLAPNVANEEAEVIDRRVAYWNVPESIAERIARSLGTEMEVV